MNAGPFAVLRRAPSRSDRLPARAAEAVRRSNQAHATGSEILRASSARLVALAGVPSIWVLGGPRFVCLLSARATTAAAGAAYALSCAPDARATLGGLVTTFTGEQAEPAGVLIEGVVPDGVSWLVLDESRGRHRTLTVRDNVYAGVSRAPRAIAFDLGGSHRNVPLPLAPASSGSLAGNP